MDKEPLRHFIIASVQWWNAIPIVGSRFLDLLESSNRSLPWELQGQNYILIPQRTLLITTIFHAISSLEKLNQELDNQKYPKLQEFLNRIEAVEQIQNIKRLRNMNEHDYDYTVGKGRKQGDFASVVTKGEYSFGTNAFWTIVHGHAEVLLVGNINLVPLLKILKELRTEVLETMKQIYADTYLSSC